MYFARNILLRILILVPFFASCTTNKVADSPKSNLKVEVFTEKGIPFLNIFDKNGVSLVRVRLGMNTSVANFERKIKIESQPAVDLLESNYHLNVGKQSEIGMRTNNAIFTLVNAAGYRLQVEVHIGEDGVAFRYRMPGKRDVKVDNDFTAFTFPKESLGYFLSISQQKGKEDSEEHPSYEASYEMGVPISHTSERHQGWCYPALIKSKVKNNEYWTMITETAVRGNYCGTHLTEGDSIGNMKIAYPLKKNSDADKDTLYPVFNNATPWRILVVSPYLKDIVENTWMTDLSKEEIDVTRQYLPGRATWSWLVEGDASVNFDRQKQYIDLADSLGFEYTLIDACWDTAIGRDSIKELAAYAREKGVGLWLWYNCSDNHAQGKTPAGRLQTRETREREMIWLKNIGVTGIKVNFSGYDDQKSFSLYEELLRDANTYELAVNFHGSVLPRGWERMFPNLLSAEAVMGMEYAMRNADFENKRASHIVMLAYTRNVVAPVDFTPLVLKNSWTNEKGELINRSTTMAFELSLPIVLCSGIQHYGLTPEVLGEYPSFVFDYLREVPAHWDEIRYIDGRPGEYIILARRLNSHWFVTAVNASNKPLEADLSLDFMKGKSVRRIISKGKNSVMQDTLKLDNKVHIKVGVNDAVIFY